MKNIFATIEYVAEKILEAITGHKNDEQAHPNLSEQINVLSSDTYIKLGNIESGTMLEAILKYVSQGYNKFECRCKQNNIVSDSPSSEWSSIRVNATEDFYYVECFTQFKAPNYFRKIKKSTGNWYIEWQQIATTTKTDISFPYNTGFSDYDSEYVTLLSKNSFDEVILNIYAKPTSGTFGTNTVKIGTLPVGYRPKKNIEVNARTSSGMGTLTVYKNGAVNVTMASGTSNYIAGTFAFDGI